MIKGCDVSRHQGTINWDSLKNDVQFAIIRSSYGTGYTDEQFNRNKAEARRVGLPIGFYHYAYPTYNTPEAEAEWFLKVTQDIQPGEWLALDFEEKYTDPVGWSKRFLDYIESHKDGYKAIIYLNESLTNSYDWSPVQNSDHGLWIAKYGANNGQVPNISPKTGVWSFYAAWQYTSVGNAGGVNPLDLNLFNGGADIFKKYGYNTPPQPAPIPQPPNQDTNMQTEVFKNIFICLFGNWPNDDDVKAFESSGKLPYTYCQDQFLYPERHIASDTIASLEKRVKELEDSNGDITGFGTKQLLHAAIDKLIKD